MTSRLPGEFFARDATIVARELLGQLLVFETEGDRIAGKVVETEAYQGWDDQASHASRGKTARTSVMFGPVGHAYLYFIYGRYWLLNVVARREDVNYGGAVLIRAFEPLEGLPLIESRRKGVKGPALTNGPARLTMALGLDGRWNGIDLCQADSALHFEKKTPTDPMLITEAPRIGINVSEPWQSMPWRYYITGNPFVSRI